ncbi:uncharacterized protein LOC114280332 [Camellia sinensis]|uniref:uncharacterized protein LOC114280332 n=1 Tax=Camellia sinensis TaxID=4442 RepID=UPI00103636DA|nr:uncharacterized protein LOC114280332 [Camellia sinensis]
MLQEPRKEEFNDWPHGFLAIGTFGNNSLREDPERCISQQLVRSFAYYLLCILIAYGDLNGKNILRAILHKKIYPQNSSSNPKATAKKYLETISHMHNSDNNEGEMLDTAANDGSKWVKTDSEFIVLEI